LRAPYRIVIGLALIVVPPEDFCEPGEPLVDIDDFGHYVLVIVRTSLRLEPGRHVPVNDGMEYQNQQRTEYGQQPNDRRLQKLLPSFEVRRSREDERRNHR